MTSNVNNENANHEISTITCDISNQQQNAAATASDDDYDGKLLHLSCVWNNSDLLGDLLLGDEVKNINSQDRKGRTALHEAVAFDSLECARLLLMNGADPNIRYQEDAKGALHLACQRGNLEIVRLLLEYHADPFLRDGEGRTPADLVADGAEPTAINDELKAAILAHESNLYNSLAIAVHKGDPALIRKLLDEATIDDDHETAAARLRSIVNYVPNDATNTLLFKACQEGHLDVVRQLLRAGADGRRQHPATKYSPLYIAAYHGRLPICQLLLDHFPEMAAVYTVEHWLPIHAAVINGHQDIVQLLLTYPYPNRALKTFLINHLTSDSGGVAGTGSNKAVAKSCDNSYFQCLMYLMPFDVNAQDVAGQTILYLATMTNNQSLVESLLLFKVKTMEKPADTETGEEFVDCLSTAGSSTGSSSPDITVIQPLQRPLQSSHQASVKTNDNDGGKRSEQEKKHYCSEVNPFKIDVYCNHKTETALHCAVKKRYYSIASILLEHGADPNLPIIGTTTDHGTGGPIVTRVSHFNHNLFSPRLSLSESLKDLKSFNTPPGTPPPPPTESSGDHRRPVRSTALREAVRNRDRAMVDLLLRFGAADNLESEDWDHPNALSIAFTNQDFHFVSKLLALKAYPDSEFKINRRSFDSASMNHRFQNPVSHNNLTVSSIFPTNAVMVDWQCLKMDSALAMEESFQRNLTQWLIDAALRYNLKLKLSQIPLDYGSCWNTALAAITRIDLSGNGLTAVPLALFTDLPSLKILNLSKNKLQTLPEMKIFDKTTLDDEVFRNMELGTSSDHQRKPPPAPSKLFSMMRKSQSVTSALSTRSAGRTSRSTRRSIDSECNWNLPCLEELYLQDNQLECLPSSLFQQPELKILDLSNNKLRTLPPLFWFSAKLSELNLSMNLLCDLPSPVNCFSQSSPVDTQRSSPTTTTGTMSKSVSTSSLTSSNISINELKLETMSDGNGPAQNTVAQLIPFELNILKPWSGAVTVLDDAFQDDGEKLNKESMVSPMTTASSSSPRNSITGSASASSMIKHPGQCSLTQLNLSHNGFNRIPFLLSCLATRLTHLNMSYNRLRTILDPFYILGHYPLQLKHLDLSHNQINDWMITEDGDQNGDLDLTPEDYHYQCCHYFWRQQKTPVTEKFGCPYKQHLKLDNLKTLILSNNHLRNLIITREELVALVDGPPPDKSNHTGGFLPFNFSSSFGSHESGGHKHSLSKLFPASFSGSQDDLSGLLQQQEDINVNYKASRYSKLFFPNLSMLDVANNQISRVPKTISYLYHLSVLNLSGNQELTALPPEMGLLTKLWNLNTRGCSNIDEPLRSMINSKSYKTSDIIGYLNSILENSKPYTRLKLMIVGYQSIGKTTLLEQLRQEGVSRSRNRAPTPDHWGKRMGNRSMNMKTPRGVTLSTVGVDLCEWTYEWRPLKNNRDRSLSRTRMAAMQQQRNQSFSTDAGPSIGPITFRTWDFGGQREYYATHQYFLSKRSIYLVVWKITDGEKGVHGMHPWLVNIQSRAPNSPVIIVGTHYDLVKEFYPPFYASELQSLIRERYMSSTADADKRGLPKVVASVEISAKTRFNIRLLANIIYETAAEMRLPGGKDRLLELKVPATYLALEEIVTALAVERKADGLEPVLYGDQYRQEVLHLMKERYDLAFRDYSELQQATRFLHENGVLLHYEDANLKDLYFLDPQWLCDMLAHVVTIREINPFVKNGIMKTEHLSQLFKNTLNAPLDVQGYLLSLLNKFELAITWDNRTLLIPSLLPTEEQLRSGHSGWDVSIPLRSRLKMRNLNAGGDTKVPEAVVKFDFRNQLNFQEFSGSLKKYTSANEATGSDTDGPSCLVTAMARHGRSIHRILMLSYVPCGFWSRLIARVLADESVTEIVRSFYPMPSSSAANDSSLTEFSQRIKTSWHCWQTGFGLRYLDTFLIRVKEFSVLNHAGMEAKFSINATWKSPRYPYDYNKIRFYLQHQKECSLETGPVEWSETAVTSQNASIIEIYLPNQSLVVETCYRDEKEDRYRNASYVLEPNTEMLTKLLVIIVEHIDTLLEDWYPSLGTRFIHTSDGRFLITRMVPCPMCMEDSFLQSTTEVNGDGGQHLKIREPKANKEILSPDTSEIDSNLVDFYKAEVKKAALELANSGEQKPPLLPAAASKQQPPQAAEALSLLSPARHPVYAFMAEECILSVYENHRTECPRHGRIRMERIAPDFLFRDLKESYRIDSDQLKFGKLLGRGSFGFVFRAYYRPRNLLPPAVDKELKLAITSIANSTFYVSGKSTASESTVQEVALKLLQPIKLELCTKNNIGIRKADIEAYTAMKSKWERDPLQYSCKAYCTARTELNILLNLKHSNIASIIGICPKPLALVLNLAPYGSLDSHVKTYRRSGARISPIVLQKTFLQISKALEYLHQQHIIYRDLKSENVLVWSFPPPYAGKSHNSDEVRLKLADYGISRSSLPTGTKGFGGTEGFMAPEIMLFNGEEEYTEKVDCFSFAMFMYELATLRFPFEGHEFAIRESILDGIRPAIGRKDLDHLPESFIDLMTRAWAHEPSDRPTMSQIVSIISAPEFCSLRDVATLSENCALICAAGFANHPKRFGLVISKIGQQVDLLEAAGSKWMPVAHRFSCEHLNKRTITSACMVDRNQMWLGDSMAAINVYSFNYNNNDDSDIVFRLLCVIRLDIENPAALTAIKSIQWMANARLVAICSNNGEVWLLNFKRLMDELANATTGSTHKSITSSALGMIRIESNQNNWPTLCISNVAIECGNCRPRQFEIWCGQTEGKITALRLLIDNGSGNDDDDCQQPAAATTTPTFKIQSQATMDHYDDEHFHHQQQSHHHRRVPMAERNDVFMLIGSGDQSYICSVLYSGFIIYQWDVSKRTIGRRLDCSKLAPCSESLMSISIEDHLKPNNCRISEVAINDDNDEIYVGTNFGSIIVAESCSLKPITVFRPYHREVKFIIPFVDNGHPAETDQETTLNNNEERQRPEAPSSPLSIKNIWPFRRQQVAIANTKLPTANGRNKEGTQSSSSSATTSVLAKRIKPFVTIGRGYRNLLDRFAGGSNESSSTKKSTLSSIDTAKFHTIIWDSGFWNFS